MKRKRGTRRRKEDKGSKKLNRRKGMEKKTKGWIKQKIVDKNGTEKAVRRKEEKGWERKQGEWGQ